MTGQFELEHSLVDMSITQDTETHENKNHLYF